jgi:ribosomal protein S9
MAAYTQGQIDALRAAIAEGVLEVESDGRRLKYRSLAEMQEVLRMMESDITGTRPSRRRYLAFWRD